jgi:glucose-1-phosphate cytidylyltransferase
MKVAILAGGRGTRLGEQRQPKALVEIGGKPIICHIMDYYRQFGFDDFLIALGYRGELMEDYFHGSGRCAVADVAAAGGVNCQLIHTGLETNTGGRIKRLAPYLGKATFMLTWCDGLANVNLAALLEFHRAHGKLATVTAVHPPSRFGRLHLRDGNVVTFSEKQVDRQAWINGAYFVLEPEVLDMIDNDQTSWERGPMTRLAKDKQLMAFRHEGFWQCMDTLAEQRQLEALWQSGAAPWSAEATTAELGTSSDSLISMANLRESAS